ncbi:MAG: hypothetical protein ACOCRK_01880 [bacterium]
MKKVSLISVVIVLVLMSFTTCFAQSTQNESGNVVVTNSYFTTGTMSSNGFPQPTNVINYLEGQFVFVQNVFLDQGEYEFIVVVYDENGNEIDRTGTTKVYADSDEYAYTLGWRFNWPNTSNYTGQMARFVLYIGNYNKVAEFFAIIN